MLSARNSSNPCSTTREIVIEPLQTSTEAANEKVKSDTNTTIDPITIENLVLPMNISPDTAKSLNSYSPFSSNNNVSKSSVIISHRSQEDN